jgi:hypothetical protein
VANNVSIKGDKELQRYLSKMADPNKTFDSEVKATTRKSVRELKIKTLAKPSSVVKTGNTSRAWQVLKKKNGLYEVENKTVTKDGRKSVVDILDQGRGVIKPKKAKRLYIPLSNKGASKPLGAKIPKSLVFGRDYIMAKKAKAFKGRKFIDKIVDDSIDFMVDKIISKIGRL